MFRRVLIANRGEIAVRVIRACREMEIEAVAVYSDADSRALHVALADRAVHIGGAAPADSYLAIDRLLEAARTTGADAIHPGYGFLSENATFARACGDAGVAFIGPPPEAMTLMGSKINARRVAQQAGAPVVPGEVPADQGDVSVLAAAERVGFPLLIKPSAGGGGIGMKIVRDADALREAIVQARREAVAAFGDGTLYVERYVQRPRHVEIQVFGDHHGGMLHLFERECSIQRRHQKVIEESPSVAVSPGLRARMGEAAVAIARAAGYYNAGTVEFLVDGTGDEARFYFLEVNARLQVEHPVTEAVTGTDLVHAQIVVAAGEPLPWGAGTITQRGHAIEARIYAEDPFRHDLPQAGPLRLYRQPSMPGVRIDTGAFEGGEIPIHYDPLIAKLIAFGEDRERARRRAVAALRDFPILGIATNIPLLLAILEHPRFVTGDLDTHLLDRERTALLDQIAAPPADVIDAIAAAVQAGPRRPDPGARAGGRDQDPWTTLGGIRL